jgi:hypothetical protein
MVFASLTQGEPPHSERPKTHPTAGAMKVTDSGWTEAAVSPARGGVGVGVGDPVGVRVGDGDGTLVDGELVAFGVGDGVEGALHPASTTAAMTPPTRRVSIMKAERGFQGSCSTG